MFGKTQRGVTERSNKPKPSSVVPKWLGMLVAFLLVLTVIVAAMLWKPWAPVPANSNEVRSEHYQEDTNKDYRFYDLLPQQQVTPIPQQAVPETQVNAQPTIVEAPQATAPAAADSATADTAAPAEVKSSYILQVRSYADPDSADARRAEILLNGLSADVVKTTDNGKVWYRVISGPYDSQGAAVIAQKTLQNSGIDSIVVKR